MLTESLLAYAHFVAILSVVVFLTSEAALCRAEWLNAAVVRRLARVDVIYLCAAVAVLLTGLARTWLGMKGAGWYWHQPLLHLKLTLFVVIVLISLKPTLSFIRWRKVLEATGQLPSEDEVKGVRKLIMLEAHLLVLIPLAATLLARGVWTR
ncbi:MAG: DUF2214 family protein [Aquabacterium sp.]|uniref:DUF2214 family protein n=1 Tax=Aquabacterium sp. TaxID=1872578 RepID=UPI0025BD0314|nr:DUF2214 family protein [Aquabacterium sp.]MBI5926584.1 DUF2214 family protein [Aquabacterium sp.]